MFPYFGQKDPLLSLLPIPPDGTKVIIEPFAGSARYSLHHTKATNYRMQTVLADANVGVANLWKWFKNDADIDLLNQLAEVAVTEKMTQNRFFALVETKYKIKLCENIKNLFRVSVTNMYRGTMTTAGMLYPNGSKINIQQIEDNWRFPKDSLMDVLSDYLETQKYDTQGSLFFIDPPYFGGDSHGGYVKTADMLSAKQVEEFTLRLSSPWIFTHGTGAPDIFKEMHKKFPFKQIKTIKVNSVHKGLKERVEYFSTNMTNPIFPTSVSSNKNLSLF